MYHLPKGPGNPKFSTTNGSTFVVYSWRNVVSEACGGKVRFVAKLLWLSLCSVLICNISGYQKLSANQERTRVTVTRIFTGPDGQTHAESVSPKLIPVIGKYAQLREESQLTKAASLQFGRFAPGFVQDWHPAAAREICNDLEWPEGSSSRRCHGQRPHHSHARNLGLDYTFCSV